MEAQCIRILKGASAARDRSVLIVKQLNKCTVKFFVSNLFLDRQHPVWYRNNDPKTSCLHEIEIQIFRKYYFFIGRKNRLDTK